MLSQTLVIFLTTLAITSVALAADELILYLKPTGGGGVSSAGGLTLISSAGQPFSGTGTSADGSLSLCAGAGCGREGMTWPVAGFQIYLPLAVNGAP